MKFIYFKNIMNSFRLIAFDIVIPIIKKIDLELAISIKEKLKAEFSLLPSLVVISRTIKHLINAVRNIINFVSMKPFVK